MRVRSFPPVVGADARVLILGSMPGKASLAARQYYAHRQNQFWPIMGALIGAGPNVPYAQRLELLIEHRIALWDVAHSCVRHSSLDSDIEDESIVPNRVAGLLKSHKEITRVVFNGHKAEQMFQKLIAPKTARIGREIVYLRLPSTSPANASMPPSEKLHQWRAAIILRS